MSEESARVLLVDDDSDAVRSLLNALRTAGFKGKMSGAGSAAQALTMLRSEDPDVVVLDLSLNPVEGVRSGLTLLKDVVAESAFCRVIVLTGHASLEHGIEALDLGAAHFLEKPANVQHLLSLIRDGVAQAALRRDYAKLRSSTGPTDLEQLIVGASPAAIALRKEVSYAASHNQPVCITGETGTGKGLCAQAIHRLSGRASQRFVRYQPNFAGADLVGSDLFGHTKGAFTGAQDNRRGLIAEANHGSLFLDEVDELPRETQVALLGVLQDKVFRPLGSNQEQQADFRLISASNQDLEESVKKGKLRPDFFHRTAHLRIRIPPLRERLADVPLLAAAVLEELRINEKVQVFEVAEEARRRLLTYEWPGNVRQLQSVVTGAAYHAQYCRRTEVLLDDLRIDRAEAAVSTPRSFHDQVEAYKLKLIEEALTRHDGNQVHAAEELELDRSTMRRILARSKE